MKFGFKYRNINMEKKLWCLTHLGPNIMGMFACFVYPNLKNSTLLVYIDDMTLLTHFFNNWAFFS